MSNQMSSQTSKGNLFLHVAHYTSGLKGDRYLGFLCRYAGDISRFREDITGGGLIPGRLYEVLLDSMQPTLEEVKRDLRAQDVETTVWRLVKIRAGHAEWAREQFQPAKQTEHQERVFGGRRGTA